MPLRLKTAPSPPLPPFPFSLSPPPPPDKTPSLPPPKPPSELLPEKDMSLFGPMPLDHPRAKVRCERCARPVLESALGDHKRICAHVLDGIPLNGVGKKAVKAEKGMKGEGSKKRRASDVSESTPSPNKKRLKLPTDSQGLPIILESGQKTLISTQEIGQQALKKSEVKKMQKEQARLEKRTAKELERKEIAERKRQRATNPVDLNRQCGVINDKNLPCSRSLTCKTHTVGAKRAVLGRSRSYDSLYLEWQRINNPNFKEKDGVNAGGTGGGGERVRKDRDKEGGGGGGRRERERDRERMRRRGPEVEGEEDVVDEGEVEELIMLARHAGERLGRRLEGKGQGQRQGQGLLSGLGGYNVWKTASYQYSNVGDLFTKALAARNKTVMGGGAGVGGRVGVGVGVGALVTGGGGGAGGNGGGSVPGLAVKNNGTKGLGNGQPGIASAGRSASGLPVNSNGMVPVVAQ